MKDVPGLFADLTAAIEDVFGIAVEGRGDDLSPDMQEVLLSSVREGLVRVHGIVLDIAMALS